ncbi:MAG TPA: hypothetical protein DER56_04625 [Thermosipho africanus]|nr:hypothetical protein [Thermosipho africanus]
METFSNDVFTILNYQGSKKNLLSFIHKNTVEVIDDKKAVFDIFAGSCSVGYAFKRYYKIFANDSEMYSSVIAKALLQYNDKSLWEIYKSRFNESYQRNYNDLFKLFGKYAVEENELIQGEDVQKIKSFYDNYPTVWNGYLSLYDDTIRTAKDLKKRKNQIPYMLFTTYYANTYFGVNQSIEIDSIRYAIEVIEDNTLKNVLLTSLFFAMKECTFSKDGHMAQPLSIENNQTKLFNVRKKSIFDYFQRKLFDFQSPDFVLSSHDNIVFNKPISEVYNIDCVKREVGFIYADPPYTDMQYSRYYHLLNTAALYDYDSISLYRGKVSKGLYRENRFQSPLSQRSNALDQTSMLFDYCKGNRINLALSFAYPRNTKEQATNRYTMDIEDIIGTAEIKFGRNNVKVLTEEYEHSNNRNKDTKKVLEYLIVCKY